MSTASKPKWTWRERLVVWEREQQQRFPKRDYARLLLALLILALSIVAGAYALVTGDHKVVIFNAILVGLIFAQGLIGACISIRHIKWWALGLTIAALVSWFLSIWPSIGGS